MIDDRQETKRGMLWLGSATALARLLDVCATFVAIALLGREQMGTAALVLSFGIVVESLSGMGLGYALIQAKHLTSDEEHGLFWLTTGIGFALCAVLMVMAPFVAHAYELPELLPMVALTGAKMIFVGAAVVPHQLLAKHLRFRESGAAQTACSLAEALTKITLAVAGLGAWSLVLANVARGLGLLLAVLWLSGFRPKRHFSWAEVKSYQSFGLRVAVSGLLNQGCRNADYFLVGKLLGVEVLGLYRVAFDVGMQPLEIILALVNRVGYPIYAKLAHEPALLKAAFLRSVRAMLLLGAPVVAFLYFASGDVLSLVNARWSAAAPAVEILVWGSLLRGAALMFPQVYVAAGRPGYATFDSALSLVLLVASFWAGLTFLPSWGVQSVCWAWIAAYPALLTVHLTLAQRIMSLGTLEYLKTLTPGVGGALVMLAAMAGLRAAWPGGLPPVVALVSFGALGLAAYAAYLSVALGIKLRDLAPRKQATAEKP